MARQTTYTARMPISNSRCLQAPLAILFLALSALTAHAQPVARNATRAELESQVALLESSATSPAYSERTRARARVQAVAVRARLVNGDFSLGDKIQLHVQGPTQLVDSTLTVGDSVILDVPGIRRVRLHGVLRSELESVLLRDVGEVVRDPRITARSLIRLAVLGEVLTPGFRTVAPETLIDELITLAGGPAATGALDKMQLVRGDTLLMGGADVSAALAEGRTIGSLGLRDGDALVIPPRGTPWDRASFLQVASFLVTPLLTLLAVR